MLQKRPARTTWNQAMWQTASHALTKMGFLTLAWASLALPTLAEGSYQINTNGGGGLQLLYEYNVGTRGGRFENNTKPLYVDIKTAGEVINLFVCSNASKNLRVEIYGPISSPSPGGFSGSLVYTTASGTVGVSDSALPAIPSSFQGNIEGSAVADDGFTDSTNDCVMSNLTSSLKRPLKYTTTSAGTYEVRFYNLTDPDGSTAADATGTISLFDITVTPNTTTAPNPQASLGRVWAYNWAYYSAGFDDLNATDHNYYITVPDGFGGDFIWQLDLNNFAGGLYEMIANNKGVNSPNAAGNNVRGLSTANTGNTANAQYRQYINFPSLILPSGTVPTPTINSFRFIDNAGVDNTITPSPITTNVQDSGFFKFTPSTTGTYAITIDTNQDGIFGVGDVVLRGDTQATIESSIFWDGKNNAGTVLPKGTYQARLQAIVGEYHFLASDVETSGGNELGLTINQATSSAGLSQVPVYWDDITGLGLTATSASKPSTSLPNGISGGKHTWGGTSSANGGGNGTTGAPSGAAVGYGGNAIGFGDARYLDTYVYGNFTIATTPIVILDATVTNPDAPRQDYGDAPDTYGTDKTANNSTNGAEQIGASHYIDPTPKVYLGTTIPDGETDAQTPLNGTGDNTNGTPNDEDGVTTFSTLTANATTYSVNVKVNNISGKGAYLVGWIDFNGNGMFDSNEGVKQAIATGTTNTDVSLNWTGLSGLVAGDTYARFRITTDPNIASATIAVPTGAAIDGEVEDYKVTIAAGTYSLSGNIFDDIDGSKVKAASGEDYTAANITAVLLDASNKVVSTAAVNATGDYTLNNVPAGTYSVKVIQTPATALTTGAVIPPANDILPTNWVATGENNNGTPDGTVDRTQAVTVASANVTNINFGIEQLPTAVGTTATSQVNPGGTTSVSVPTTLFASSTDPNGTVASYKITAFPTNATTLTINSTPYISATFPAAGVTVPVAQLNTVQVDPIDGAVNVDILFKAIDDAGQASSNTATGTFPFTAPAANSCSLQQELDNPISLDFSTLPTPTPSPTDPVGTVYTFSNVAPGINAKVTLEALQATTVNSILSNSTGTAGLLGANIRDASSGSFQFKVQLVSATTGLPIPPVDLVVTSFDIDGQPGNTVTDFAEFIDPNGYFLNSPTSLTSGLTTNGVKFTNTNTGFNDSTNSPQYAAGAFYFDTNSFTIRGGLQNASAAASRGITFDAKITNISSFSSINCSSFSPTTVSIFGNVFSDLDSSKIQNGAEVGTNAGGLNAVLVNNSNIVVAVAAVNSDGTYSFIGVPANASYTVQITTNTASVGATPPAIVLPNNWMNTGENLSNTPDTLVDSKIGVTAASRNITEVNFGIKQQTNANILLVKRITAINGAITNPNDATKVLNTFIDDPGTTNDNNANWPVGFLKGAIDGGKVQPGDTIEYTIYFLNAGGSDAANVRVCDRILGEQKLLGTTINLQQDSNIPTSLTTTADSDRGTFYPTSSAATNCNFTSSPATDNGAVVVNVTGSTGSPIWSALTGSTAPGTTNSYGFVRFTTKINL